MSIRSQITTLESDGKLAPYLGRSRHPPRRRLYLTVQANKDLTDPNSATYVLVGRGIMEAALERWVTNGLKFGNKKRGLFLDRLCPPPTEIWEIRVTEPIVQARMFGRFAEPDTLILTRFHTRRMLGDKGSPNWKNAMAACEAAWQGLFPSTPPYSGNTIHSYVTENCDDFPI